MELMKEILAPRRSPVDKLVDLATNLHRRLAILGIHRKIFNDRALRGVERLTIEHLQRSLDFLERYLDVLEHGITEIEPGMPIGDQSEDDFEKRLVSIALDRLGLKHSRFSETEIKSGDVIEIYTADGIQVYRNLEFFKYSSYTLLELITFEWFHLYNRPAQVTTELMGYAQQVVQTGQPCFPTVPPHLLEEIMSEEKQAFMVDVHSITPLQFRESDHSVAAILTRLSVCKVGSGGDLGRVYCF